MQPIDVRPDHLAIVRGILARYVPEAEVWVFGSRAKWLARDTSDLDLCIRAEEPVGFSRMGEMREAFEESSLPYKVDVVDWEATSEGFRKIIERDKVVVQKGGTSAVSPAPTFALTTLGDICAAQGGVIQTGPFGSQLHTSDYKATGVPVVMPTNIGDGGIVEDGIARIDQSDVNRLSQHKLQLGDIVFSRRGDVTKNALIRRREADWICGTGCLKVRLGNESIATANFISHYLRLPEIKKWLIQHAVGATMPNLNTAILSAVPIKLPPVETQVEVAATLDNIDDRITVLRETSDTLEAIAQALFKSWFVDFDPVRAKAEGREPEGVPPEIAELFPSEFEESELGEIPKGWSVSTFGDIADVSGGGTPSTKDDSFWTGGTHCWATPKDLSALDFPVLLDTERKITNAGLAKISSGLLPVGTLLMSSRAPIGYVAIAEVPTAINQGFIAMRPKNGATNLFLLSLIRWRMDDIKNRANGSTFMEISKSAFRPIQVVMPVPEVVEQFDLIVRTLYNRLVSNMRQVETLAKTRDSMLPRLMSGHMQVET